MEASTGRENVLMAVSNAMVALHKEQFGRGPTKARSQYAGKDILVCTLEAALTPAERNLVELGEDQRVREMRVAFQAATASKFTDTVERITGRTVRAFMSALDATEEVAIEVFIFNPVD